MPFMVKIFSCYYLPTPNALKIFAAGQKPVKADWSKLKPIKVVNHTKLGCTKYVSNKLISTITPANAVTALLIVIIFLLEPKY